jgi:amphi-Trp domain-containing protein
VLKWLLYNSYPVPAAFDYNQIMKPNEVNNLKETAMAKKNVIVKSDVRKSLPDVAAFLRELADKIEANQVTLQQGPDEVSLTLPDTVDFELEFTEKMKKKKGVKRQLEIEIEWYKDGSRGKREEVSLG